MQINRESAGRRLATFVWLFCGALPMAACVSDPPTVEDIHLQTGTLADMPLTEGWKAGAVAGSITDNWLASFNDTQLNTLVAEAMVNNNDLRVSAARVEQAGQYVELAQSALRPAVNIFGTGGANMGGGEALQYFSLGASWELDLWGRLRYGRNAYRATYASAQADFEFGRRRWRRHGEGLVHCDRAWLQLKIAQDMVAAAGLWSRWRRPAGGSASAVNRTSRWRAPTSAVSRTRSSRYNLHTRKACVQLNYCWAAIRALNSRPATTCPPCPAPSRVACRWKCWNVAPTVAAERRVAAAFNRVGEAKAARLPRLVLNANVADIQSDILELQEDFESPTAGWEQTCWCRCTRVVA
jgi:hypothetical protein